MPELSTAPNDASITGAESLLTLSFESILLTDLLSWIESAIDLSSIPFSDSGFSSTNLFDAIIEAASGSGSQLNNIVVACSDETTALTTGSAKVTFRMPYAMTLTGVKASVTTAPTGSVLTVDINEGGASILSTKLTIDATEKTSVTAATPAVISDSSLAADAEITIDIDTVGSTVAGAGLKVTLLGAFS